MTATAVPTDATAPTAAATFTLIPTEEAGPTEVVEGATFVPTVVGDSTAGPSGPSDPSTPAVLLYGAAALLGLIAVLGGGWLYATRPWQR